MDDFRMASAAADDDYTKVFATHPAQPGTYLVFAFKDETTLLENVIMWAVGFDCCLSPITMHGVWGGSHQSNICVLHPDGKCQTADRVYASLDEAVADLKKYDKSE
jgi:hypothetical protein